MIERATRQKITEMPLPSVAMINARRKECFGQKIKTMLVADCAAYADFLGEFCARENHDPLRVAAVLAKIAHNGQELLLAEPPPEAPERKRFREQREQRDNDKYAAPPKRGRAAPSDSGFARYRIEAGENHGVGPANIVGAIAGETPIASRAIGRISIFAEYSHVDLPLDVPPHVLRQLFKVRVNERMMKISRLDAETGPGPHPHMDKNRFARSRSDGERPTGRPTERKMFGGNFRARSKTAAGRPR
jgi:ATP-dependent RNA helicase DeaD